jgi:succinoglycan biosynthesis transport protein ExoP
MDDLESTVAASPLKIGWLQAVARRQWWVVVVCALVAAIGAAAYAELRPPRYQATVVVDTGVLPYYSANSSSDATQVPLPDPLGEAQSYGVKQAASAAAGVSPSSIKVSSSLSTDGSQISLSVTAPGAREAAQGATAAASAFVKARVSDIDAEAASYMPQLATLARQLNSLDAQAAAATRASHRSKGTSTSPSTTANPLSSPLSAEISVVSGQYSALYGQQVQLQEAAQLVRPLGGTPSVSTVSQGKVKIVGIALGAGLIAGAAIGLLRDLVEDRLSQPTEVTQLSKLPLLAELPYRRLPRKRAVTEAFGGRLGEAVRELRTGLALAPAGRPLKTLLVVSASTGEGKSFVAANLAVAWALTGARTIAVSTDLRHPALERLLGVRAPLGSGLPRLLEDWPADRWGSEASGVRLDRAAGASRPAGAVAPETERDSFLVPTRVEGLSVLPAGALRANPAEVLSSSAMVDMMGWLRERADVIILDSPPLLAVTDALVLSGYADGVLLVVASGRSSKDNVRRVLRLLERSPSPVLGYVVNRSSRGGLGSYPYPRYYSRGNGSSSSRHRRVWAP